MGKGKLGVKNGEGRFKKTEKAAWMSEYNKPRRDAARAKRMELRESGCVLCGYSKCMAALEFHHVGDDKRSEVNRLKSPNAVIKEASKCIVVCANCHREIHAGQIDGYENIQRAGPVAEELPLLSLIYS